ncbi:MAG: hypothetical protein U1A77_00885 [Pirellulales bacterium]
MSTFEHESPSTPRRPPTRRDLLASLAGASAVFTTWQLAATGRAAPPNDSTPARIRIADAKRDARLMVAGDARETTIEVRSESGIGRATLELTGPAWPESLTLRLHLQGLESLSLASDSIQLEWSVPSSGEPHSRVTRRLPSGAEQTIDSTDPYFAAVRLVGEERQIPLKQGYFELRIPRKLLEGSARSLRIQWIDFYRG